MSLGRATNVSNVRFTVCGGLISSGGWGGFPPTTYRRPWHYNSSTYGIPPLKMGGAMLSIEKISFFKAYPPLYFLANSSTAY